MDYRDYLGVIWGIIGIVRLYWGYIGKMEKKKEATNGRPDCLVTV